MSFLGSAIGQAIAGGIYTNTFRDRLRIHLPSASDDSIESLFNSITGVLPEWGTTNRMAVNLAYSDVMRYITIVALVVGGPMIILAFLLPNVELTYAVFMLNRCRTDFTFISVTRRMFSRMRLLRAKKSNITICLK